jgi:hypothetical protein
MRLTKIIPLNWFWRHKSAKPRILKSAGDAFEHRYNLPVSFVPPLCFCRRPAFDPLWRRSTFGDYKDDLSIRLLLTYDLIARFPNQIGNIDRGERIGAAHLQLFPDSNALEGLACLQGGQRAFEAREI